MFTFEGREIPATGQTTIAAALVAAGDPGAVFCAIGVCFACLVTINDGPPERACLAIAADGDVITRAT